MNQLRVLMVLLAAGGLASFLSDVVPSLGMTRFDDAYMFARYAKHALAGHGFCWNIGEGPSHGSTSTLHLLLVTAARGLLSASDAAVLTGLSFAGALVGVVLLVVLGFQVLRDGPLRRGWVPLAVVPLLLLGGPLAFHAGTGMETTLALACNAALAVAVVPWARRPSRRRTAALLAVAYVATLARPDSGLYALLLPPLLIVAADRERWRTAARYAALLVVILAVDLLVKWLVFGYPVPLPFFAKAAGFHAGYTKAGRWNAAASMLDFLAMSLPFLAVAALASRRAATMGAIAAPVLLTVAYLAGVTQIMGQEARYYLPTVPFVVLAAFVALDSVAGDDPGRLAGVAPLTARQLVPRLLAVVFLAWVTSSTSARAAVTSWWERHAIAAVEPIEPRTAWRTGSGRPLPGIGWWRSIEAFTDLARGLPPGTSLAASEYGYLGAELPDVRIVDLAGLHDRAMALGGFSADRVLDQEPDVIWFPHRDYTGTVAALLDAPAFATYAYYPGAYEHGVAIRLASPRAAAIMAAFEAASSRLYRGLSLGEYRAWPVGSSAAPGAASGQR